MRTLRCRVPAAPLPEAQAIQELFARSPAFRVVAPTPEEAYALLHELVAPLCAPARGVRERLRR